MLPTLIADSGSTKTDWAILSEGKTLIQCQTQGINPYMLSDQQIESILLNELVTQLKNHTPQNIQFYGAGCRDQQIPRIKQLLQNAFPKACSIQVHSDLLGAARALCGNKPGIACILGTGSNSCFYDGKDIKENISPLGYILGDEGSGAVLGKRLIGDILKKQLPPEICQDFTETYNLSSENIIQQVYRQPLPNRFLAQFTHFLKKHEKHPKIHQLIEEEFSRFLTRNVVAYNQPQLSVNFIGSIAYHFADILREALQKNNLKAGKILRAPFEQIENLKK